MHEIHSPVEEKGYQKVSLEEIGNLLGFNSN